MNPEIHIKPRMPYPLDQRPQYRGMPVPFTAYVDDKGVPDFRVTDPLMWRQAVMRSRCGLCGEHRNKAIWFIGGPRSAESGLYYDPGMHLECALYALQVCPYLAMGKGYAAFVKVEQRHGEGKVAEIANMSSEPPDYFVLMGARIYATEKLGDDVCIKINPKKALRIEVPKERDESFDKWMDEVREQERRFVK